MRLLILDAKYPGFLDGVYERAPGLSVARYATQMSAIRHGLFGEAHFQVDALRELGHQADVVIVNAMWAQRAWAIEHGFAGLLRPPWKLRLRGGVLPWVSRNPGGVSWDLVLEQIRAFDPDVVYVGILDTMPPEVVARIKTLARLVVAQVAATVPPGRYDDYDLVVSSIPSIVDQFRGLGIDAAYVPLAFDPSVVHEISTESRDVPVSFVGSFTDAHPGRVPVIEAIARSVPLQSWTADRASLPANSPIVSTIRGSAYGREMYAILARSRITINSHAAHAGQDANNLRLYEATGMGALLVTEQRRNLGDLFDVGREVVAYDSPSDAAAIVGYYLDHPAEANGIAHAGQVRTLRDHTWIDRMAKIVAMMDQKLGQAVPGLGEVAEGP